MTEDNFEVGDVVALKSAPQYMVVEETGVFGEVEVVWLDGVLHLQRAAFNKKMLVKIC